MNLRYVLSFVSDNLGERKLFDPMQGRFTYSTFKEANERLQGFLKAGDLSKILSQKEIESLSVSKVECYPGHNDPKSLYI